MADLNPAIPLDTQAPQIENPAVQQTQYAQAQTLQQETMQRVQAMRDQATINTYLAQSNGDPDAAVQQMTQAGFGTAAMALQQRTLDYRAALGKQMDDQMARQGKEYDLSAKIFGAMGDNPDPNTYAMGRQAVLGIIGNDQQAQAVFNAIAPANAAPQDIPGIVSRISQWQLGIKDKLDMQQKALDAATEGKYNYALSNALQTADPDEYQGILNLFRARYGSVIDPALAPFALAIQNIKDPALLQQKFQSLGMTEAEQATQNKPTVIGNKAVVLQGPNAGQVVYSGPNKTAVNESMTVDGKPMPVLVDEFGNTTDMGGNPIDPRRLGARPPASVVVQNMKEGEGGSADPKVVQAWVRQLKDPQSGVTLTQVPSALRSAVISQLQPGEITRLTAQDQAMMNLALKTIPSIDRVEQMAQQINAMGLMGTVGSQWRKLISGQSAATDLAALTPQQQQLVGQFVTEAGLITSGVARVHGGARGGGSPRMQAILAPILEPRSSTLDTYIGHLEGARDFMKTYALPPDRTGQGATSSQSQVGINAFTHQPVPGHPGVFASSKDGGKTWKVDGG